MTAKVKLSIKFKDIDIESHTYYFLDDIINIKNCNPNIYYGYVTIKDSKYLQINSARFLYLNINKVNGYFEEINKNDYLTLVPTNESKEIIKKYKELWSIIRDSISSVTKKSDNYDEK